jgi:hypothetical protein
MSETETNVQDNSDAVRFNAIRKFNIVLETGETRAAEIRIPTYDEQKKAEEYGLSVIAEKSNGETDPLTGKLIKLPTRDNMIEYAKEKGMWSNEDDVDFTTLEAQLSTKIEQLARGKMKLSKGYELATQIMQHRKDILPYNQRRWQIYGLTADAAGEEAMHRYMCVATTIWSPKPGDTEEERVFPNLAAFEKASSLRNEVLNRYMALVRMANDHTAPIETELGFFREYGFLDSDGNIYDVNKKEIVTNILSQGNEESDGEILSGFTDDSGNVIERAVHPSIAEAWGDEAKSG